MAQLRPTQKATENDLKMVRVTATWVATVRRHEQMDSIRVMPCGPMLVVCSNQRRMLDACGFNVSNIYHEKLTCADSLAPFWLQPSSMFPGIVWVLHTATSWDTEPSCEKRVAVCPHNGHSKQGKMMLNLWTWGIPMYTPCSDKPSCRKIAPMMPSLFSHPSISVSQLWTDKDWRCENQWDLGRECRCQRLSPIISDRREGEVRSQCLKGSNAKFWNRQ